MSDKAVSPVIGVILMVAITVILAAVITAFVFQMSAKITYVPTEEHRGVLVDVYELERYQAVYLDIIENGTLNTYVMRNQIEAHHLVKGEIYQFTLEGESYPKKIQTIRRIT